MLRDIGRLNSLDKGSKTDKLTFKNRASYIYTATLQMLHFIYMFFQKIPILSILNMLHILRFSLQNAAYFMMLPFFGLCIIHILHTGCAKI
jgi:hypothetical protein